MPSAITTSVWKRPHGRRSRRAGMSVVMVSSKRTADGIGAIALGGSAEVATRLADCVNGPEPMVSTRQKLMPSKDLRAAPRTRKTAQDRPADRPALVSARHAYQPRARSRSRRLHMERPQTHRPLAQALGGAQPEAQSRFVPLRPVDADLLPQSRRQEAAGKPAQDVAARQD